MKKTDDIKDQLLFAIEEVIECLILENMHIPSFTSRRIKKLAKVFDKLKNDDDVLILKDGEPCQHIGCLHHITHPCEGCGRIAGQGEIRLPQSLLDKWKNQ